MTIISLRITSIPSFLLLLLLPVNFILTKLLFEGIFITFLLRLTCSLGIISATGIGIL